MKVTFGSIMVPLSLANVVVFHVTNIKKTNDRCPLARNLTCVSTILNPMAFLLVEFLIILLISILVVKRVHENIDTNT